MTTNEREAGMTATLAEYVEKTKFGELPSATVDNAKLAILDTVGVALAASRFEVGRIMVDHVKGLESAGPVTAWAGGFRASAPMAAYLNGHLANALDFDNSLHLDTHVLPAGLAVGEQLHVSGTTFLEAYIVSREVGARLMGALDGKRDAGQGVSHRGWWHAGLVGPLDAALVAARLLELDQEAIQRALGIASASVGGFRRNLGTMAKSLHSGKAARDGVHAALLAKSGFSGDPEILEAAMGLINALCPNGEFDDDAIYSGLGSKYNLESPPKVKPYPSCGPAIGQIDSAIRLLEQDPFTPDEIDRIEVNFHPNSLFRPEARAEIEAAFSTPFIIAATIVDRGFGLGQVTAAKTHDPQIRAVMELTEHNPSVPDAAVVVHLQDGRVLTSDTGGRRWLTSWEEVNEKYRQCAEGTLAPAAAEEFAAGVAEIDRLEDVSTLTDILYRGQQSPK